MRGHTARGDLNPARSSGLAIVDEPRSPPLAPKGLRGKRERELWSELWSDPVAATWGSGDGRLVVRLAGLYVRLEAEGADAPGWIHAMVQGLEDRLALNPRARRAAGIVLVAPPAPPKRSGRAALDAATRRALERDLRPVKR